MARHVGLEQRLCEWGAWREWQTASGDVEGDGANDPHSPQVLQRAIAKLPAHLATAVTEVYRGCASTSERARRLGCPESTVARRIGQAHRLLIDILATRLSDDARERERGTMARRLGRADTPL